MYSFFYSQLKIPDFIANTHISHKNVIKNILICGGTPLLHNERKKGGASVPQKGGGPLTGLKTTFPYI